MLINELKKIHARNYGVYGVRKMWHAARRAGWNIGRDQVARLMKIAGIAGVRRGGKPVTTKPAPAPDTRPDLVRVRLHSLCRRRVLQEDRGLVHQIDHDHRSSSTGGT